MATGNRAEKGYQNKGYRVGSDGHKKNSVPKM